MQQVSIFCSSGFHLVAPHAIRAIFSCRWRRPAAAASATASATSATQQSPLPRVKLRMHARTFLQGTIRTQASEYAQVQDARNRAPPSENLSILDHAAGKCLSHRACHARARSARTSACARES